MRLTKKIVHKPYERHAGGDRPAGKNRGAALVIYIAVWAYALIVPVLGSRIGHFLYSTIMPPVHGMLGYFLFVPITVSMERRWAAVLLTMFVVFVLALGALALVRRARGQRPGVVWRTVSSALMLHATFIAFLCMCEAVVAGTRTAPLYLYAALPWILFFAYPVSADWSRFAKPMLLIVTWLILAAGLFGHMRILPMGAILVLLYAAGSPLLYERGFLGPRHWGLAGRPLVMMLLCTCCGMGAVGSFWKTPVVCNPETMKASGAFLIYGTNQRPYDALIPFGTRQLYIAYKRGALEQYDLDKQQAVALVELSAVGMRGSTQRLVYNPEKKEIYTTDWRARHQGAVVVFGTEPLRLERIIAEPKCPAISLQLDHATRQLIVLCESGRRLVWFHYDTWLKQGELRFPLMTQPHAVRLDPLRRRIYVCTGAMSHFLYEIDADSHRILRRTNIGFATLGMEIDPLTRRAYLAKPFRNEVLIVDLQTMKIAGAMKTQNGPRDMEIDVGRKLLYVGNYVAGTVQVFDLATRRVVSTWPVAKQVRGVYHSPELNRHFAATACGVAELKDKPAAP